MADFDRVFNENLFVYHPEIFSEETYTLGKGSSKFTK